MTQSLVLPFPMRNGKYMAQVVLPRDMTKEEAARLCAFVMSLASPAGLVLDAADQNSTQDQRA